MGFRKRSLNARRKAAPLIYFTRKLLRQRLLDDFPGPLSSISCLSNEFIHCCHLSGCEITGLTLGRLIKGIVIWFVTHVCKTLGYTEGIAHITWRFGEFVQPNAFLFCLDPFGLPKRVDDLRLRADGKRPCKFRITRLWVEISGLLLSSRIILSTLPRVNGRCQTMLKDRQSCDHIPNQYACFFYLIPYNVARHSISIKIGKKSRPIVVP